ncbi:hypothetical protein D915_002621 [Fasciola hepatica]|uniref:Uncharacterized protein n=1 Tax=Fasciola hepatica TaxID=6192 RepID=A0A4E0RJG4_FASHE|nr:hypothetical protein D915_002621 [Fasciola hepatica]
MDNFTTEIEHFITFPGSSLNLIERCLGFIAMRWAEELNQLELNNVSRTHSTWIVDKQLAYLQTILRHNQINESSVYTEMDQNCPTLHAQSTIAHTSLAVGFVALLIHILLVFFINHGLVRLYGPCLLVSIFLTALHNLLLFASSYVTSNLETTLQHSTGTFLNQTRREISHRVLCPLMDVSTHYLSISVHLSVLFALLEQYNFPGGAYKKISPGVGLRSHINSPPRAHLPSKSSNVSQNSFPHGHGVHSSLKESDKYRVSEPNVNFYSCSNDFRLSKDVRQEPVKVSLRPFIHLLTVRWYWIGPLLSMCLPCLPVAFGLWLHHRSGLENMWNPTYGVLTCGSVGSCLAGMQILFYLPVGLILAGQIALIFMINMRADHTPDPTAHSVQYSHRIYPDFEARCCMIFKFAGSQLIVWITAFVSNHVCLVTMWQLYAIFTGLQGLYVCVSFTFARPFLEVVFKKNDPLRRLKLDNLVMQLPLGIVRGARDVSYIPRNSSSTLSGVGVFNQPGHSASSASVSKKSMLTKCGTRRISPGNQVNTALLTHHGPHQC